MADEPVTTWQDVPQAVWGSILLGQAHKDAFAVCTFLSQAMLHAASRIVFSNADNSWQRPSRGTCSVLRWAGAEHTQPSDLCLELKGNRRDSISKLLQVLQEEHIQLYRIKTLACTEVFFDMPSALLASVFPALTHLHCEACDMPPGHTPLSHATTLRRLALDHRHTNWDTQLQQLNQLPNLNSLSVYIECTDPCDFLAPLTNQLTCLELDSTAPDAQPRLELFHTLTQLRNLQRLQLDSVSSCDDVALGVVLQLSQLTCLYWRELGLAELQQSWAEVPCTWRELHLGVVRPATLAQLPLTSVSHVHLAGYALTPATPLSDITAGARSLAGKQLIHSPVNTNSMFGQFCWSFNWGFYDSQRLSPDEQKAASARQVAVLQAAKPLVPAGVTELYVGGAIADAALVQALAQLVSVESVTSVTFDNSVIQYDLWIQLARSFPHTTLIDFMEQQPPPPLADVMGYYCAVCARTAPGADPTAAKLTFYLPTDMPDLDPDYEEQWELEEVWEWVTSTAQANRQLQQLGFTAKIEAESF